MTSASATYVVLLTPEGRGAVASLAIEGPAAAALVDQLFQPAGGRGPRERPVGRILVGRWLSSEAGEEVVVTRRDSERFEVHCHGGAAAARALVEALEARGCQQADWRQRIRRTADDPIAAAAEIALTAAPTARTAAILWDQRSGALRRAIDEIGACLAGGDPTAALARVEALLAWAPLGRHLVEPWQVVLAGRPNVGKSSLVNALVGYQRAIVHQTPGTTRDVVTAGTALDGWPVELADTAGLHDSDDVLEAAGIELARRCLAEADLVLLVSDASRPNPSEGDALAQAWPAAIRVFNKCDLLGSQVPRHSADDRVYTSALTGEAIDQLTERIGRRLVPQAPQPGEAIPFRESQVRALAEIARALADGRPDAAAALLASPKTWDAGC